MFLNCAKKTSWHILHSTKDPNLLIHEAFQSMICSEFAQTSVQFTLPPTNWQSWNLRRKLEPITSENHGRTCGVLGQHVSVVPSRSLSFSFTPGAGTLYRAGAVPWSKIRPQRPTEIARLISSKKQNGRNKDFLACRDVCMTFWRNELLGPRKSDSDGMDCAKNVCFFCMLGAIFVFAGYVGPCSLGSKLRIPKAMNHHHHRTTTTTQPPAPAL